MFLEFVVADWFAQYVAVVISGSGFIKSSEFILNPLEDDEVFHYKFSLCYALLFSLLRDGVRSVPRILSAILKVITAVLYHYPLYSISDDGVENKHQHLNESINLPVFLPRLAIHGQR